MLVFPRGNEHRRAYDRVRGTALCRKHAYNRCGFAHGCVADRDIRCNITWEACCGPYRHDLHSALRHNDGLHNRNGVRHSDGSHGRRNAVLHNGLCLCRAAFRNVQPPRQTAVFTIVYHSKCSCGRMCVGVQAGDGRAVRGVRGVGHIPSAALWIFKPGRLHGAAGHRRQRRIGLAPIRCAQGDEPERRLRQPLRYRPTQC